MASLRDMTHSEKAKHYLKHYLYQAGNTTNPLRPHPDSDKEIDALIDNIVEAAAEAATERVMTKLEEEFAEALSSFEEQKAKIDKEYRVPKGTTVKPGSIPIKLK
jgi:hypothetical protein